MSRDIYKKGNYVLLDFKSVPLPIRWMSLESLKAGEYTHQSDVVRVTLVPDVHSAFLYRLYRSLCHKFPFALDFRKQQILEPAAQAAKLYQLKA